METVKENVYKLLETDVRARNDDKYLLYLYWSKVDGVGIYIPFDKFKELTPFETISRCRRDIQNKIGLFPPTQQVSDNRQKKEEDMRAFFSRNVQE